MKRLSVPVPKAPLPLLGATYIARSPEQALRSVTSKSGLGVYASSDRLFRGAVFGRDSLEVAEDLMLAKPKLVRQILLTIASLQGETLNAENEEEPGKIIHEYRTPVVDGKPINNISLEIFTRLSQRWGGTDKELAYYGSVDSTPLFARTLVEYCRIYGTAILNEAVRLRSGRVASMLEVLDNCLEWISAKLSQSRNGLLEYHRLNPNGIENQVWKDSAEFYIHSDGSWANHQNPIASIETQAIAYDALNLAAKLLPSWEKLKTKSWRLRSRTIHLMWMPAKNYFGAGIDYDHRNNTRLMDIITANPAEVLDSTFFDNLEPEDYQKYVSAIVSRITGEDFLTDAGIRSRSLSENHLVSIWDYHGSFTTWPKETYDIAKGLRRHGFAKLADELDNRLLNIVRAAGCFPEFIYVDGRNRVLGVARSSSTHGELMFVDSSNSPEKTQSWTVSAILGIRRQRKSKKRVNVEPWKRELERDILRHIPHVKEYKTKRELTARYPFYPYELNRRS